MSGASRSAQPASDILRWHGDDLDDEFVWTAVLAAADAAADDAERRVLGDGLIDEQVATRPELRTRWHRAYDENASVRAVFKAVWAMLDSMKLDYGWWARPRSSCRQESSAEDSPSGC